MRRAPRFPRRICEFPLKGSSSYWPFPNPKLSPHAFPRPGSRLGARHFRGEAVGPKCVRGPHRHRDDRGPGRRVALRCGTTSIGHLAGHFGIHRYGRLRRLAGRRGLDFTVRTMAKILWWPYADAYTPGVLLAIAIVRVGCFLNWDDYGVHTKSLWGVDGGDGPRYPTQLFMSFGALVLFFLAGSIRRRTLPPGTYFLGFAMAEAVLRFWIEWLRDEPHYLFALTAGQWTAGAIIAISLFALRKRQTKQPVPSHGLDFRLPPPYS